jgi:hypothetical protein
MEIVNASWNSGFRKGSLKWKEGEQPSMARNGAGSGRKHWGIVEDSRLTGSWRGGEGN